MRYRVGAGAAVVVLLASLVMGLGALRPRRAGASPAPAGTYRLVTAAGDVFAFGGAGYYGHPGPLNKPVVGMAATPDGGGYWLVAADGGIFTFGDAAYYGSTGGIHLNKPVVGMAATPDGHGYWLVAADGGIFTFGDAAYYGSTGGIHLNKPVVGMAATPDGHGYWLAAADGGIFTFGDAPYEGSGSGAVVPTPVVGMAMAAQSPVSAPSAPCSAPPLPDTGTWAAMAVQIPSLPLEPLPGDPPPDVADTPQSDVPAYFSGTVLAPADTGAYPGVRPAVVVLHGASGNQCQVWWLASFLAGDGYVAVVLTSPQPPGDPGPGEAVEIDAARSAVDFLASTGNPYLSRTDANNVAVAGWSQGSIAASEVQDLPDMSAVKAIVALDNLRGSLRGDLGAPVNFCDGPKQGLITAVVPALGFADDYACDPGNPADVTPQSKQSGWAVWAAAGRPAVELPMAGFQHGTFTTPQLSVGELSLDWLQAWLGGQASTLSAFDACTIAGVPTTTLLASNFYSAAYLPALGLDTSDLGGQLQATC